MQIRECDEINYGVCVSVNFNMIYIHTVAIVMIPLGLCHVSSPNNIHSKKYLTDRSGIHEKCEKCRRKTAAEKFCIGPHTDIDVVIAT